MKYCFTLLILSLCVVMCANTQTWNYLDGPNRANNLFDITTGSRSSSPDTIYAVDDLGLYRSVDGGSSWTRPTQPGTTPQAVACQSDNPLRVYAAAYDAGSAHYHTKYSTDGITSSWSAGSPDETGTPFAIHNRFLEVSSEAENCICDLILERRRYGGKRWSRDWQVI